MRRLQELKNSKRLLAGPYLFWAVSFIIIPLIMIFYYGLTDNDGKFTWMNLAKITTPENLKALGLALLLAFVLPGETVHRSPAVRLPPHRFYSNIG